MNINIPKEPAEIMRRLEESGFSAYAVGGCVRDALMGKPPCDWDITTDAPPELVHKALAGIRIIDTGIAHGTVTALYGGGVEITTFRAEGAYSDGRHPDSVRFGSSLSEDLSRRDFTVNAMACPLSGGLCDPFGGRADVENKILRSVGVPEERFSEDALRILRGLRFSSVLGFAIEEKTEVAMNECAPILKNISGERIYKEISGLLLGADAERVLRAYPHILKYALPEMEKSIGYAQRSRYHIYDVWTHTAVAAASAEGDAVLKWALIFHDLGKPDCFSEDAAGCGHYYAHAQRGGELAHAALGRMGVRRTERESITRLVKLHDNDIFPSEISVKRWLVQLGEADFSRLLKLKLCDEGAKKAGNPARAQSVRKAQNILSEVLSQDVCISLSQLAVRGGDMAALGASGVQVGTLLHELFDAVIDGRVRNNKQELTAYAAAVLDKRREM